MNTKTLAVIISFAALATVLSLIRIPAPYMPTFTYYIDDIVIVVGFLLFGIKIGAAIMAVNLIAETALVPSPVGIIGGPYGLLATFTMVLGVYVFEKVFRRRFLNGKFGNTKAATAATGMGLLTRVLIMLPLDYYLYGFLVSLVSGLSIADSYALIWATMPFIILYNVTVPLYVIPISYLIAKKASGLNSGLFKNALYREAARSQIAPH